MSVILICYCRTQISYLNFATFFKDSLAVFTYWFCPVQSWQYTDL